MYYIKEQGFYYSKVHGPYQTLEEAIKAKPRDLFVGKEEAHVRYVIESASGNSVQFLQEEK